MWGDPPVNVTSLDINPHALRLVALALVACMTLACDQQAPSPSRRAARETEPSTEETPSGETHASSEPLAGGGGILASVEEPAGGGAAAEKRPLADNRARIEQLLGQVARETEETRRAAGETHCERAWTGVQTLTRAFAAKGEGTGRGRLPDRGEFLRVCGSLPEEAQRCMTIAYSLSHQRECAAAREALAPEQQEQLNRMFPSGR